MIADLKPYPEYKESGSRWLSNVPLHWEVHNLRTLIRPRHERNHTDLPLLSVARERGVFVRSLTDTNENHNVIPEDLSNYKVARAGCLVINKMKAWQGSMGIAPCDGIVSPAYFVFDFGIENRAFGQALLRSKPYVSHFGQASDGVRVGQWDLTIAGMRQIPVLVPLPAEQAAIVRFLIWSNGRLERAIRAKRKVIALLNEQKQTIIHRAVTRGLDPSVPFKSSGIPWLGDIPQHWEVRKLRHMTRQIIDGTHFTPNYRDDGVAFLRVTDIHEKVVDRSKLRRISKNEHLHLNKRCNPEKGDLLLSKNGTIGITKVIDWDFPFSIFVSLCLIKPIKSLVDPHFISFTFSGGLLAQQLADTTKTTSVTNLHLDKIRTLILPLPPLAEQSRILVKTRAELAPIDTAISRLKREIELLREYRTRLVADVVTGKLDVREAACLSEEVPPETVENELDLTDETESADEEAAV